MTSGIGAAAAVVSAYLLFCGVVWLRHAARRKRAADEAAVLAGALACSLPGPLPGPAAGSPGEDKGGKGGSAAVLVAYASQTGLAESLAWQTARALHAAGMAMRILPLDRVDPGLLAASGRALFVVSTTGEGDAPENAVRFARRLPDAAPPLHRLEYGVLALGDSGYADFCGFGRRLDGWLAAQGASALFQRIDVDSGDPVALAQWWRELGILGAAKPGEGAGEEAGDGDRSRAETWRIVECRLLNPCGLGAPAYHVGLEPMTGSPRWQAGDIAVIEPRNPPGRVAAMLRALDLDGTATVDAGARRASLAARLARCVLPDPDAAENLRGLPAQAVADRLRPLPYRQYSIACLAEDGRLELLVRQVRHPDGTLGLGSGWLTGSTAPGRDVTLRIRRNTAFHAPADDRPVMFIGNGTGLAGLRAHIRARAARGHRRNWLIYGERSAAGDFFHRAEIEAWRRDGTVARIDLAFSRDGGDCRYVQDCLAAAAPEVRRWISDGAAVYVCGSRRGMAGGVDDALREILGADGLARLADGGGYRRDVY